MGNATVASGGVGNDYDLSETNNQQTYGGQVSSQEGSSYGIVAGTGATLNLDLTSDAALDAVEEAYKTFANKSAELAQGTINTAAKLADDVGEALINKSENVSQTIARAVIFAIGAFGLGYVAYTLTKKGE